MKHPELRHELVFNTGTSFFVYLDECTYLKPKTHQSRPQKIA